MSSNGIAFIDDTTIPDKTIIFFAKKKGYYTILFNILLLSLGIYLLTLSITFIIPGLFLILATIFLSYKIYKNAQNISAQIILCNDGIETAATQFYNWIDIKNESIFKDHEGGLHAGGGINLYYLVYDHPLGSEKVLISDLDTTPQLMTALLAIYRGRSNSNSRQ